MSHAPSSAPTGSSPGKDAAATLTKGIDVMTRATALLGRLQLSPSTSTLPRVQLIDRSTSPNPPMVCESRATQTDDSPARSVTLSTEIFPHSNIGQTEVELANALEDELSLSFAAPSVASVSMGLEMVYDEGQIASIEPGICELIDAFNDRTAAKASDPKQIADNLSGALACFGPACCTSTISARLLSSAKVYPVVSVH